MMNRTFLQFVARSDPSVASMCVEKLRPLISNLATSGTSPTPPKRISTESDSNFIAMHPVEVAEQLTYLQFETFRSLSAVDFLDYQTSVRFQAFIMKAHKVTLWVLTEFVVSAGPNERIHVVRKFIKIAEECLRLANYHGMMAIVMALNFPQLATFACSSDFMEEFTSGLETLNSVLAIEESYKTYRFMFATSKPPAIPLMPVFMEDMSRTQFWTPVEKTHSRRNSSMLVDFHNLEVLSHLVGGIRLFQKSEYTFQLKPHLQNYLLNLQPLSEAELTGFLEAMTDCTNGN